MFQSPKWITNVKYYLSYEILTIFSSLLNWLLESVEYLPTSMGKVLVKILGSPHMIINLVTSPQSLWLDYASSVVRVSSLSPPPHPRPLFPTHTNISWMRSFCYLPETSKINCRILKIRAATEAAPYHSVSLTCLNSWGWKVMMAIMCPRLLVRTMSSRQYPPSWNRRQGSIGDCRRNTS